jgi:putative phosphoesterase
MTYRLAVLADVHADVAALDDALKRIERLGCNEVVCAGDVVGYGDAPDETIARLHTAAVATVRGNHDRWLVERVTRGESTAASEGLRDPRSLAFLQELRPILGFSRLGVRIVVCHGSPRSDIQQVLADEVDLSWCRSLLEKADADVLVVGHSHLPAMIHVGGTGLIVNPGALLRSSDVVSAPGTFGVLELPSRRFTVFEAASGREVAVRTRYLR